MYYINNFKKSSKIVIKIFFKYNYKNLKYLNMYTYTYLNKYLTTVIHFMYIVHI